MGVDIEHGKVINDVSNKNGWKVVGFAKRSKSKKSINLYYSGRLLVLDIADLFELVAGHYDAVDVFEHV
ncbi:MAG: hypothetical protein ACLQO7_02615 [Candidatus Bathyarchaeia archaeon]